MRNGGVPTGHLPLCGLEIQTPADRILLTKFANAKSWSSATAMNLRLSMTHQLGRIQATSLSLSVVTVRQLSRVRQSARRGGALFSSKPVLVDMQAFDP